MIVAHCKTTKSKEWKNSPPITFEQLSVIIKNNIKKTPETSAVFITLPDAERARIKDVGGIMAGVLKTDTDGSRAVKNIDHADVLIYDADTAALDFKDKLAATGYSHTMYTTRSHTPQKPRWRLLLPLDRSVTIAEYHHIICRVAQDIGVENFCGCSYRINQVMYYGSYSSDAPEPEYITVKGLPVSADAKLSQEVNWELFKGKTTIGEKGLKLGDPRELDGIVGAFCRVYSVSACIEKYLSDVYTLAENGRYLVTDGTTPGLQIYDDDLYCYSYHSTHDKAANGHCSNAFNLFKIHRHNDNFLDTVKWLRNNDTTVTAEEAKREFEEELEDQQLTQSEFMQQWCYPEVVGVTALVSKAPPPQKWLIPDFLPASITGLITGEGGSSKKSMALLTLCLQLAITDDKNPEKWLGTYTLPRKKSLYISLEDGIDHVHRRLWAIMESLPTYLAAPEETKTAIIKNFFVLGKETFFSNNDFSTLIDYRVQAGYKFKALQSLLNWLLPDLVVIDTRSQVADIDENDNQKNAAMMGILSAFNRCVSQPTVLLVSHVSKAVRAGLDNHAMNSARGAGALGDASRWLLWFKPLGEEDLDTGGDLVQIIPGKSSYSKVTKPITVAFKYPRFILTNATPDSIADKKQELLKQQKHDQIIELLAKNPIGLSRPYIKARVICGNDMLFEILQNSSDIEITGSGPATKYKAVLDF